MPDTINYISGRVVSRFDMDLKFNGMNNGYGYFLKGTNSLLDGLFLGITRKDVENGMAELNMNRRNLNLPQIKHVFTQG